MSIYQIVTRAVLDSVDQYRNVLHYEFPGYVPQAADLQAAVDAIDTTYKNRLQALFPLTLSFQGYDVRRVDTPDEPTQFVSPTGGGWAGSDTAQTLPPQTSLLVTFKAPTTFPRTARSYLFPLTEEWNASNGRVVAGALANALSWGTELLALAIPLQPDAVKVTVRYGGDPRVVTASNVLTTVRVASRWATQRSRRPGEGI